MKVTEHVHAIKIPFQLTISPEIKVDRFVYAYLIYGKKICLIDSGVASSERTIFDYLMQTGREPDEISMLIQTHSHPDHIGATQAIKKISGCTIAAHPNEKSWIEDVDLQARERPVPGFHTIVEGSVDVDRTLGDGDILDLGKGLSLEVFHTPGHSNGSISLFLHGDGALFSGDAIPRAGDLPIYDDVLTSVKSIKTLKNIDGIKFLLSSWDDPKEGGRVYELMDEGMLYLQRIHDAVIKVAGDDPEPAPMVLCRRVLEDLGLPTTTVNPLVVRSFASNLKVRHERDLLKE
ncbi:MBL fold metallo-hydrolase [bacterium]|nr:MBL fold metallo-hydrolase [bacterium]